MSNELQVIVDDIYGVREQFERVISERSINFEREAGFAVQVLEANTYALSVAHRNRQSVINAVTNVAAIGLSLNPATKLAYLVPRKTGIVLEISYIGLVKLATDSGSVRWVKAELVHEADDFGLNGMGQMPTHKFNPFAKDRGPVVGVYCVAKTIDGDYLTEVMSIDEAHAIRDRSEAWKNGQKGPWATDAGEMIRKTVVKRASKLWPRTERLDQAIHYLNTVAGEGIAEIQQEKPEPVAPVTYPQEKFDANFSAWSELIQSGKKTAEGLIAFLCSKQPLSESQKQALRDAEKTIDA